VHRAFPFAEWIAARQAASGLLAGAIGIEPRIDLVEHLDAIGDRHLFRLASRELEELQRLVDHQAARRRSSISESIEAAFGLTSQK
jgi:hypothetical protein